MRPLEQVHWQILILGLITVLSFVSMGDSNCPSCDNKHNPTAPQEEQASSTPTPLPTATMPSSDGQSGIPLIVDNTPVVTVLPEGDVHPPETSCAGYGESFVTRPCCAGYYCSSLEKGDICIYYGPPD